MEESRTTVIEGRAVRVVEHRSLIPTTLQVMLEGGRDPDGYPWRALRVLRRSILHLGGTRPECLREDHRMKPWLEGFLACRDGQTHQLRLVACQDCGAVCVRDVTLDSLPGLHPGRLALRQRDKIIGWYTGSLPRQRQYT